MKHCYAKYIRTCFIFLVLLLPLNGYAEEKLLNILYTGSLNGELEPCGCSPKTDFGGMARLSGYISDNKKALSPYLLLDAGNFAADDTPQGRLKTETLLKTFSIMKYDSVSLQNKEASYPDHFISALTEENKVPYVSNTHHYKLSITKNKNADVHLSADPGDTENNKLNVLLTDLPLSELKSIKGWDVIINSSGELIEDPVKTNGTIIVTGYPKGKKLGVLTLYIDKKGKIKNYTHRWQPFGDDIKEDTAVRQLLNDYDARVAALLKESEKAVPETAYLGVSKCVECHQPYVERWENSRHARAFADLEKAGKASDPECTKCHTVGFGETGGFYSIKTTPGLANVQCENCHGAGKEHIHDFDKPMKQVTESVCLRCHTKDQSPDFIYKDYLEKIRH